MYVKKKIWRITSICLVLLITCTLPSVGKIEVLQMKSISLKVANKSLKEAFSDLEKKTDYLILMMDGIEKDLEKIVNVNVEGKTIDETLDLLLKETNLTYKVTKKQITIQKQHSPKATQQQHTLYNNTQKGSQQQSKRYIGTVKDENGETLIGATVSVPKTTYGTSVDVNGNFILEVPSDVDVTELIVSYVGYKSKTIKVSEGDNKPLHIILDIDAFVTEEVVVTGVFNRKKEGFSGTTVTINKEQLQKAYTGNIFTTLSTLDAGFKITENLSAGSDPNELAQFTIRGKGSFQSENTLPLFIMDGFEISQETFYDYDIERIESITLLKDASATILYGSRASNGVIVIETIQPKEGELRLSYNFRGSANIVDLSSYNMMNSREKLEYEKLAGMYDKVDLTGLQGGLYQNALEKNIKAEERYQKKLNDLLSGIETDWLSKPIRNGFTQSHSLSASGGSHALRYNLSLSYGNNQGVMKGSDRDNFSFGNTLIYRIKDKIVVSNNLTYSYTKSKGSPYGSYSQYVTMDPHERIYNEDGTLVTFLDQMSIGGTHKLSNPLYNATLPNESTTKSDEIRNNFAVDWNVFSNLRLRADLSISKTNRHSRNYISPFNTQYTVPRLEQGGIQKFKPVEERGSLTLKDADLFNYNAKFTANFNKIFKTVHALYLGVGGTVGQKESDDYQFIVTGFTNDNFKEPSYAMQYAANTRPTGVSDIMRDVSAFATINYIFDERYFVDFSINTTGSSSFGANNRFGLFWSVGGGWNIHKEKFIPKWINMLRPRASYGVTGNQSFRASNIRSTFEYRTNRLFNTTIPALLVGYGNKDLKWETIGQLNLGFDFSVLDNRLSLNFNHYRKTTENTISDVNVSPSMGFPGNIYRANIGSIQNIGSELQLTFVPVRTRDLDISIQVQAAKNTNKVLEISNSLDQINNKTLTTLDGIPGVILIEGRSMSDMYVVKSAGIDPGTGREIFIKKDGTLTYEYDHKDKVYSGNTDDDFSGIIGLNIAWRNFTLSAGFLYRYGADRYNSTIANRIEGATPYSNSDKRVLYNRWKKPGDIALYRNIRDYGSRNAIYQSSRFIQKDNAFECSNINFTYDLPKTFVRKIGLQTARVNLSAQSPFHFYSIKQERGLDYPFQRSYTFGLNFTL